MLIIYKKIDGKIINNLGKNSLYPMGVPNVDEIISHYTNSLGGEKDDYGFFRLHDINDAETVNQTFTHQYKIDNGKIVFGEPITPSEPEKPQAPMLDFKEVIERLNSVEVRVATSAEKYDVINKEDIGLQELKDKRILKLKEECSNSIYNGFFSDTMRCSFGFNENDQVNFTQRLLTIVAGTPGPFQWKSKDLGVVEMSREQFVAVTQEAEAHKLRKQEKYWALEATILRATNKKEVDQVVW